MDRWFGWIVLALLALMAATQVASIRQETQTWDEGFDIGAGYSYLLTGDYRINADHPPLGKLLNAFPLLFLHPDLPLTDRSWEGNGVEFGRKFLYQNRVHADTILFASRCVTIAFTLVLGCVLAFWTRRRLGSGVALLALSLYALDPNIIAHGRYVTSDPFLFVFAFLACITWSDYLVRRTMPALLLAGAMLGCALASKMSAMFLPPVFILLYVISWWHRNKSARFAEMLKGLVASTSILLAVAFSVVMLSYAPEIKAGVVHAMTGRQDLPFLSQPLAPRIDRHTAGGQALFWIAEKLNLPSYTYLVSLNTVWTHLTVGHESYLLGQVSSHGWWYYFPVAILVKTPTVTLLLFAFSVVAAIAGMGGRVQLRKLPFECYALGLPAIIFLALATSSPIDIGIRHVLCVYPLLFVLCAWTFVTSGRTMLRWAFRPLIILLVAGLAAESLSIYPNYLAFFNTPSGGPRNGPHYLLDSNLDWGQDLKKLKAWIDSHDAKDLFLFYFGNAPPAYYGIETISLPTDSANPWNECGCLAAISATPLFGLYVPPEEFAFLRKREPIARIGYSIYIYDLRIRGPLPSGTYDDTHRNIRYTGNWIKDLQFKQASKGSLTYTNEAGANIRFLFHGSEITYVYTKALNRGIAEIIIDGASKGTVDLYSRDTQWQSSTRFGDLPVGDHELVIRVTGTNNPASSGAWVDLDALVIK